MSLSRKQHAAMPALNGSLQTSKIYYSRALRDVPGSVNAGKRILFAEQRAEGQAEGQPGTWGWYALPQIPMLVQWLDSGSQNEFDLAEDIYQAFRPYFRPDTHDPEVSDHTAPPPTSRRILE